MKKAPKLFAITAMLLVLLAMKGRAQSVCTDDNWTATSTTNPPSERYVQTMVWTGSEMIVWGGSDGSIPLKTGGVYNVSTDTWRATSTTNAPTARQYHAAVWTGSEMIVWGGGSNTGGRYNPSTDSWTPTSTVNAPSARSFHTALWTGSEMIVWGGGSNTGGRYNPSTDTWIRTSTTNAPGARENHTAVWTGSEMIVWGGDDTTGGRYNPVADTWTPTSTANAPAAREYHTAVWTGSEMIVWGGSAPAHGALNSGGRYDPSTNSWAAISTTNAGGAREGHTAVWTGTEMIVWGGDDGGNILSTGGRYDRGTDSWTATNTTNAPTGSGYHTTVLTGTEMIVWGGVDENLTLVSTGRRYCAQPRTPVDVSGTISYCSNPISGPVADVTFTLSGDSLGSTQSDGSGNYQFFALASGGTYLVTPSKPALTPGTSGINTMDVLATQRHFLGIGTPLSGCRLAAADVNGVGGVGTADVIAIQRFFLGLTTGISNTGKYQFIPASRSYEGLVGPQTGQDYDELVLGDVAPGFVHRPSGPLVDAVDQGSEEVELPTTVATLSLPVVRVDQFTSSSTAAVTTSAIDGNNKLVGFQGDFLFDERVIAFESDPVQRAGLTGGNWNVSGNVLDGVGPMRRLRISAYSNDFRPLSGSGTLFELRMTNVSKAAQGTPLLWAPPPDHFIFIDADLNTQKPGNAAPGSVTMSRKHK